MVITYEDASRAIKALLALRESRLDDKQLLGIMFISQFYYIYVLT